SVISRQRRTTVALGAKRTRTGRPDRPRRLRMTQRGHCLCIAASRACANLLPVRFHRRVLGPIESPLVPLLDGMLPALRFGAMLEVQALRAVPRYAVEHGRDHLRRL